MRTSVGTLLIDLSNSGLAAACARAGTRNIAERSIADAVCHRVVASEERTDELVLYIFDACDWTTIPAGAGHPRGGLLSKNFQ